MKSLICKEILGTKTLSGASAHSLTASDIPEGTKSMLITVDDNLGTAWSIDTGYSYSTPQKPDAKNHLYLHKIWSNGNQQIGSSETPNFNLAFARDSGNFSNITVVYLR